jgi:hypothetical protein
MVSDLGHQVCFPLLLCPLRNERTKLIPTQVTVVVRGNHPPSTLQATLPLPLLSIPMLTIPSLLRRPLLHRPLARRQTPRNGQPR